MKPGPVLIDTGVLVAFFNRRDQYHDWAIQQFDRLAPPMLTCESVLSETCFLLRGSPSGIGGLMATLTRGVVSLPFRLEDEHERVAKLMAQYANIPMSLADACLVRMAELFTNSTVLTLDSDFRVYRKHGRAMIPTIMPGEI